MTIAHKKSKKPSSPKEKLSCDEFISRLKATENNNSTDAICSLNSLGITSPLIISGGESLRVKRIVEWLYNKVFRTDPEQSTQKFYGAQLNSSARIKPIVASLRCMSLFSKVELIVISEAEVVKAATAKPLSEAITSHIPSVFVVIITKSINTKTPLPTQVSKNATLVEVKELKGKTLINWITKEAQRSGAHDGITADAAELLARCYGNNLWIISQELGKLALLTDKKGKITRAEVENILLKGPERTSFELMTQIAKKQVISSTHLCNTLLAQGLHPLQVSNFLSRAFRTLIGIAEIGVHGNTSQLSSELSNPWFMRNLRSSASAFTLAELRMALSILSELDLKLKSSGLSETLLVSLAVKRLALREPSIERH